jgi:hypothetical protein
MELNKYILSYESDTFKRNDSWISSDWWINFLDYQETADHRISIVADVRIWHDLVNQILKEYGAFTPYESDESPCYTLEFESEEAYLAFVLEWS